MLGAHAGSGNDARSEKPFAGGRRKGWLLDAFLPFGGGNHKGPERGGPLLHHGEGLLEEAQYGMEIHEDHGSNVTKRGKKRGGERGLDGAVQADRRVLVEWAEKVIVSIRYRTHDVITTVGSVWDTW